MFCKSTLTYGSPARKTLMHIHDMCKIFVNISGNMTVDLMIILTLLQFLKENTTALL